jgi:hypothetical protein
MPSTLFKDMSLNSKLRRSERGFLGDRALRGDQPLAGFSRATVARASYCAS